MVHAITNEEDPNDITIGGGGNERKKERKLTLKTSSNIGKIGSVDKNSKVAELQKMIQENKTLGNNLNGKRL